MESEALLNCGSGSAEGWTRVRARTCRGNRVGSDNRLRRACSFVEPSAARGCGDGINSSGVFFPGACGVGGTVDIPPDNASSWAVPSWAVAVLWNRDCILWLRGVISRCAFFAAAKRHDGRRGDGLASNCEAHLE
jgi:hypothetical protein